MVPRAGWGVPEIQKLVVNWNFWSLAQYYLLVVDSENSEKYYENNRAILLGTTHQRKQLRTVEIELGYRNLYLSAFGAGHNMSRISGVLVPVSWIRTQKIFLKNMSINQLGHAGSHVPLGSFPLLQR